jgi:hypothetical protein
MRRRRRRKDVDHAPKFPNAQAWVNQLPWNADILVAENGAHVGKISAGDAVLPGGHGIYECLQDDERFGPGNYTLCSYHQGAIRGRHVRAQVGRPSQWRRGSTRVEAERVVEWENLTPEERKRREIREAMQIVSMVVGQKA